MVSKMQYFLIFTLFICAKSVSCSVFAPAGLAAAPLAYTRIAPPAIAPFANSVNTFTRGLSIFAAPYAAGVLPPQSAPVVAAPSSLLPAPFGLRSVPSGPVPFPLAASPYLPAPSPYLPAPSPYLPAPSPYGYFSAPLPAGLPPPVALGARSVHAVAPSFYG